jgi:exopolysaccharide biosynthesis operon protein EpsL
MNQPTRLCLLATTLFAAICVPGVTVALWNDQLELFAAQAISQDDNIFRLGRSVDPLPILGTTHTGDRYLSTSAGLRFDIPVSAQRFVGSATLERRRYDRFSNLDLDAHAADIAWLWQLGRRFEGRVGYSNDFLLGSFANLQGGIQTRSPNFIRLRRAYGQAGFRLATNWELRGSMAERQHSNSALEFRVSDARIDEADLGLYFTARSGNRVGLMVQSESGWLPRRQLVGDMLINNSYEQRAAAVVFDWRISEPSRMGLRIGQVSRSYRELTERDFSDWMLVASYEWRPSARFSLTALAERNISASEEVNIGFVFVERLALRPRLRVTERFELSANIEHSDRAYLGDSALRLIEGPRVNEQGRVLGLTMGWMATPLVHLNLGWRRQERNSVLRFAEYESELLTFEVRVTL